MSIKDMTCDRCGGPLIDAAPVEIYCPNDECFKEDLRITQERVKAIWEKRERAELARLKAKYEGE